jgi:hypothetical protein
MGSPRTETIKITPQLAVEWLEKNTLNRNINQYRVYSYANDMKLGQWKLNGDTIRFAKDGTLLDGQHRLWAIVEAGIPVTMMVVFDLDEDVRTTIDTGRPRSTADFFKMVNKVQHPRQRVAVVSLIETFFTSIRTPMGYAVAWSRYQKFKEGIDWSFKTFPTGSSKIDITPVRAAMALAYPTSKSKAAEFAQKLRSGAGLSEGDPALALRNYLLERLTIRKDDPRIVGIKVLTAFHAYLTGTHTTKVYQKEEALAYFAKLYPDMIKASPAKQLAAQPVATTQSDLEVEIRRVPSQTLIDVPRPWAKKGVTVRRKSEAAS